MTKKKTSSTSTQNSTQSFVSTPTNPDWSTNLVQGLAGQVGGLSKLDPYSLVAGQNPLQTQAAQGASGLGLASAPQVQSASLLEGLGNYMNPYTNDVVDTTLRGFDQNAGMTRAQQQLDMANSGAFGGSGAAITRSMTEGQLAQQRAATEAGLRDQAFNTGAGLSNLDAGRRQDASSQNAQLLLANDANNRANVGVQAGLGGDLRAIEQQKLQSPISLLSSQVGLAGNLPLNMFSGTNANGTSQGTTNTTSTSAGLSPLDWFMNNMQLAGAALTKGGG